MKILSYDGLAHFWEKVKEYIDGKTNLMPVEYCLPEKYGYDYAHTYCIEITANPNVLYYCYCDYCFDEYTFNSPDYVNITLNYDGVVTGSDFTGKTWSQAAEYYFEIAIYDTVPEISFPADVLFPEEPVFEPNTRYHISIVIGSQVWNPSAIRSQM